MDGTEIKRIQTAIDHARYEVTLGLNDCATERWATIRLTSGEHIRIQRDHVTLIHNVNDPDPGIIPELMIEDIPTPFGTYTSTHGSYSIDLIIRQPFSAMCRAITIDARYVERVTESYEMVERVMVNTVYHKGGQ